MILPREGYALLELIEKPIIPGKLILTNDNSTPMYKVLSGHDFEEDEIVFLKGYPIDLNHEGKTYYLAQEDNIIARYVNV